ncbi:HPr kinase/phosphorylase [Brevundimonas sp.]|uniref:HPr kinase/phosphorylase n=1 Tax=Brevundimonas sp. TaxID=1871086 RepID=UPI0040342610
MTGENPSPLIHATSVARHGPEGWSGVLLTGPSGAGKSDMALRLVGRGWRLVSDDYSRVWRSGEALYAAPPETLPPGLIGCLEARGLGVIPVGVSRPLVRIALVVVCGQTTVERLPEPEVETLCGLDLPRMALDIRPASASETLERALARIATKTPGRRL